MTSRKKKTRVPRRTHSGSPPHPCASPKQLTVLRRLSGLTCDCVDDGAASVDSRGPSTPSSGGPFGARGGHLLRGRLDFSVC